MSVRILIFCTSYFTCSYCGELLSVAIEKNSRGKDAELSIVLHFHKKEKKTKLKTSSKNYTVLSFLKKC